MTRSLTLTKPELSLFSVWLLILFSSLAIIPSHASADWYKQQRDIMGTRISVELWHSDELLATECGKQVFAEMYRLDELMSPYRPGSEITFINNNASIRTLEISTEMSYVIDRSLHFSEISGGAFDITFASIGYRYDYRNKVKPSDQQIELGLPSIDYRHIKLNKNLIRFENSGVRIDLGGIAKGYAVDRAIQIVKLCGISEAMVSAGGDSKILGMKRGKPWTIGIQHPRKDHELALVLPLSDTAISTSGDYQRFFILDGNRIHHIINPSTGKSATQTWSATVIGPDAMTTDALSTTIFVLGATKGIALIETLENIDAVIIDNEGNIHYSPGLREPNTND